MDETMHAAVFLQATTPLAIRRYPVTVPQAGMAAVLLESSGICGTDVHIWDGAIGMSGPIILGHEFLGRVQAFGAGERCDCRGTVLSEGDLVAVNVIEPCGICPLCTSGGAASCLHLGESLTYTRSVDEPPHFHGGFAEINYSPIHYLQKLPSEIPADVAIAFLCAGPTVVRGVAYAGGIRPGEHVVVQGAGPVGLFAVLYAKGLGAGSVTMLGTNSHPLRLELARELGADLVLDIHATDDVERAARVRDVTGGIGADLIIEGTGNPAAVVEGLSLLRPVGRYILAGQYSNRGATPIPTHLITFNALQIFGSAQFTAEDRATYFDFLLHARDAWETVRRVVTDHYPVTQANDALTKARSGQSIKTVFVRG